MRDSRKERGKGEKGQRVEQGGGSEEDMREGGGEEGEREGGRGN